MAKVVCALGWRAAPLTAADLEKREQQESAASSSQGQKGELSSDLTRWEEAVFSLALTVVFLPCASYTVVLDCLSNLSVRV